MKNIIKYAGYNSKKVKSCVSKFLYGELKICMRYYHTCKAIDMNL